MNWNEYLPGHRRGGDGLAHVANQHAAFMNGWNIAGFVIMLTPAAILIVTAFVFAYMTDKKKFWQVWLALIGITAYVLGVLWLIKHK